MLECCKTFECCLLNKEELNLSRTRNIEIAEYNLNPRLIQSYALNDEKSIVDEDIDSKLSRSHTKKFKNRFMKDKKKKNISRTTTVLKKSRKSSKKVKNNEIFKMLDDDESSSFKVNCMFSFPESLSSSFCESDCKSDCLTIKEILSKVEKGEIKSVFKNINSPEKSLKIKSQLIPDLNIPRKMKTKKTIKHI